MLAQCVTSCTLLLWFVVIQVCTLEVHCYISWYTGYPFLYKLVHCCPLLNRLVLWFPLLYSLIHWDTLLYRLVHCGPLLNKLAHSGPLLCSFIHWDALLYRLVHCSPLLNRLVHRGPLFYRLEHWAVVVHFDALLSVAIQVTTLWSVINQVGTLGSVAIQVSTLWSVINQVGTLGSALQISTQDAPRMDGTDRCGRRLRPSGRVPHVECDAVRSRSARHALARRHRLDLVLPRRLDNVHTPQRLPSPISTVTGVPRLPSLKVSDDGTAIYHQVSMSGIHESYHS